MKTIAISAPVVKTVAMDAIAVGVIYSIPTVSHTLSLPLYYIEPMRMMIMFSMVHSSRPNVLFLALTLPWFSYAVSYHPAAWKALLISVELCGNVLIFYYLNRVWQRVFICALVSVIVSKLIYYSFKFLFLSSNLLQGDMISTPIYFQMVVTIVWSIYLFFFFDSNRRTVIK